jgi:hypothetical protein
MTDFLCDCCSDLIEKIDDGKDEQNYDSLCDECSNGREGCCK